MNVVETRREEKMMIDNMIKALKNTNACKHKLAARLVNATWYHARNDSLRGDDSEMIHDEVADDLMVVYSYRLDELGPVLISKGLVKQAGVKEADVKKTAMENSLENEPTKIITMAEIFGVSEDMLGQPQQIVISNNSNYCGAIKILNKEVQEELAKRLGNDYMLIPSSIHEWIAIPNIDVKAATEMIRCVNSDEVDVNEQLSDHPYTIKNGKLVAMV